VATPPNGQFVIPTSYKPGQDQEAFDRQFNQIITEQYGGQPIQVGQYATAAVEMARHGVDAAFCEQSAEKPANQALRSERFDLNKEEPTLFDAMREMREEEQLAARTVVADAAVSSETVRNSIEHINPPLTPEEIAQLTESLTQFRAQAVLDADPRDIAAIPEHAKKSDWGLAA